MRRAFPVDTIGEAEVLITTYLVGISSEPIYRNKVYQVTLREVQCQWGDMWHLSIKRNDREIIHDWRDLQEIKNQLIGEEHEGIELYPAESRRVDSANQYHIFVLKEKSLRFPFGFDERLVTEDTVANSKQRPFDEPA